MTQENIELLATDISARWFYGVKGIITYDKSNTTFTVEGIDNNVLHLSDAEECHVEDFKSYLRPMSSMTEEEKKEAKENGCIIYHDTSPKNRGLMVIASPKGIDWLNKKMFAYRTINGKDMFELGIALRAPEGMYK